MSKLVTKHLLESPQKNSPNVYSDYFWNWYNLAQKYNFAIYDAGLNALHSLFSLQGNPTKAKKIDNLVRASFDSNLRKLLETEEFATSLGEFMKAFSDMVDLTRHNLVHKYFDNLYASLNILIEPFRDSINRTPSDIIKMEGKFDLLHYKSSIPIKHKTPILVVGSLINRYYILDLLPKVSIIKKLQNAGFDVYATDWRTPNSFDKDMTLDNYAHEYVEKAVDKVREISGSEKVSLFGYCWGGIFSLIQSAIHPQKIKNLILHATPTDLEKNPTSIEIWTKKLNADRLVEVYGNVPGHLLNLAFLMRNPIEAVLKYPRFFSEPRSTDEIKTFFAIESWLYDGRPIIGEVFRKIVDNIYKKNLLIKNEMKVGGKLVDLKNVTMPFLNIVGERDDLVPPQSSKTISNVIASNDKQLIEFPTGHVGLCIGGKAHEKLWPNVVNWLAERS
ncbi:MAG: alpha/beta fold hydrolase [Nitrosopumilaceae archaeon]